MGEPATIQQGSVPAVPGLVIPLWGDGVRNDALAIRHALTGGIVFDDRSGTKISFKTVVGPGLPPGVYRLRPAREAT